MVVLAPGSILQSMFFGRYFKKFKGSKFLEVGPGSGHLTSLLLKEQMSGTIIELSKISCDELTARFSGYISDGLLDIRNESFLSIEGKSTNYDLVVSAMVLEHLDTKQEQAFIEKCLNSLKENGVLMLFVPANSNYWGVEDEIAGHFRRYLSSDLIALLDPTKWEVNLVRGLTWPLSNILLPISNFFVKRAEIMNLSLEMHERTLLSGHRDVMYKTVFPRYFRFFLNPFTLYPFYVLQNIFKHNSNSLVLFMQATKVANVDNARTYNQKK